jgi:hypothetical protein
VTALWHLESCRGGCCKRCLSDCLCVRHTCELHQHLYFSQPPRVCGAFAAWGWRVGAPLVCLRECVPNQAPCPLRRCVGGWTGAHACACVCGGTCMQRRKRKVPALLQCALHVLVRSWSGRRGRRKRRWLEPSQRRSPSWFNCGPRWRRWRPLTREIYRCVVRCIEGAVIRYSIDPSTTLMFPP